MTDADGNLTDDKAEEKNQINAAAITSPKKKPKNIKEEEKVALMDKINEDLIAENS